MPWEIRHFYNLLLERFSKSHWKIFGKCIELHFRLFKTLFWFFFYFDDVRDKCQRNEKFFSSNQGRQSVNNFDFLARRKNSCKMEILLYVQVQKIIFVKKKIKCKRYSMQWFHFWKWNTNWFWGKYVKRKLFIGIISYGAPNKPEAYLEPCRIFAKKLSHRCSTGF